MTDKYVSNAIATGFIKNISSSIGHITAWKPQTIMDIQVAAVNRMVAMDLQWTMYLVDPIVNTKVIPLLHENRRLATGSKNVKAAVICIWQDWPDSPQALSLACRFLIQGQQ